ncbi:AraC family transcriptional regulator [Paenibacillus pinihumi]|uniref:AraC family transcriptional regulator n=1 Tax=Paenibacillus pinihumi TaxID=669462 RepID=UPI00041DB03C|nr:helix-turn-helix domain-containing protein [Paenibacillus pinihumi]
MEQIKIISDILLEIEEHLYSKALTPEFLAGKYYTNVSDLQKTFQILTGYTIGEYIRNRRLSNAAISLQSGVPSILETALSTGYETPEAFSKAFKRFHGKSPKEVRSDHGDGEIQYFGPKHIKFSMETSAPLTVKKEAHSFLYFVGKIKTVPNEAAQYVEVIKEFWQEETMNGSLAYLEERFAADAFVGLSLPGEEDRFKYGIGVLTDSSPSFIAGYEQIRLPSRSWAKFKVHGETDAHFREIRHRVLSEWLLISNCSISMLPEIEYFPEAEPASPEIWFPVNTDDEE